MVIIRVRMDDHLGYTHSLTTNQIHPSVFTSSFKMVTQLEASWCDFPLWCKQSCYIIPVSFIVIVIWYFQYFILIHFFSLLLKFCLTSQFLYFVHIDEALWIHFLHFLFTVSQNPRAFQKSLYYGDFRITPRLLTDDQYSDTTQQTPTDHQNLFQIPQRLARGQTPRL